MPKADLTTDAFYAPITKVDKTPEGHRIVTGVLQSETPDVDGQVADYAWFKSQAEPWFQKYANVREMHDRKAVGKGIQIDFDDAARRTTFVAKVVDRDAVMKLDEGVLTAFSFGVKNDPANPVKLIKSAEAPKGRIVGGAIIEASLVDRPANEDCVITIAKMAGGTLEETDVVAKAASPTAVEVEAQDAHVPEHAHDLGTEHQYSHSHDHVHDQIHAEGEPADHSHLHAGKDPAQAMEEVDADVGKAANADLAKRDFSDKKRDQMADEGTALPDGSFPIANKGDIENAVKAYGRAKDKSAAKAHIIKRAKALDATDMLPEGWLQKTPEADLSKDAAVPVLEGDEAAHNGPLNDALSAIKTLINQELAEDDTEFDCVNWLSGIAQSLLAWANSEQAEGMDDDDDDDGFFAAFADLTKAAAEPDLAKRRVFYSREHRTAVEQALRNLTALVAGDAQGPVGVDPTGDDAPAISGNEDGQVADIADQDELHADGDGRVREPDSVEQAGPSPAPGSQAKGSPSTPGHPVAKSAVADATASADTDLSKYADLTGYAIPDDVKAAMADLLKGFRADFRAELEEDVLTKFASAERVEDLERRAQPGGAYLAHSSHAINEVTAPEVGMPIDILEKMARFEKLTKNPNREIASSARASLKQLQDQYGSSAA